MSLQREENGHRDALDHVAALSGDLSNPKASTAAENDAAMLQQEVISKDLQAAESKLQQVVAHQQASQ